MHHAIKDLAAFLEVRDGLNIFKEGRKQAETAMTQLTPTAISSRRSCSTLLEETMQIASGRKETPESYKRLREYNGKAESTQRSRKQNNGKYASR